MTNLTPQPTMYSNSPVLLMAIEVSQKKWRLCFSNGSRYRNRTVESGDFRTLEEELSKARKHLGVPSEAPVHSVYEAGRDAFWIHRQLIARGIKNIVTDSASIEVNRRARRAKTDNLDATQLVNQLRRYLGGERKALCPVNVPSVEAEDARRPTRHLERLKAERTATVNRMKGLLATHGVPFPKLKEFKAVLPMDSRIPPFLRRELLLDFERFELINKQIATVNEQLEGVITGPSSNAEKIRRLMGLKGIGGLGACVLVLEFFGWRGFKNRRQVGGAAGLGGTPYDSGDDQREQGISKAGSGRIRHLIIQLAWGWIRHQPESAETRWFQERFSTGKRVKKVGIVALGRKLLVALWRYAETGVVPKGARLKEEAAA